MASWNDRTVTNEHILPYVDSKTAPSDVAAALNTLPFERNIFKLLANAPAFFGTFMKLLSSCWSPQLSLRSSDWQTVVLRTAATLDAPYEWDVNEPVARIFGFSDAQLDALRNAKEPLPSSLFTPRRQLIARFVDEINSPANKVSEPTVRELKATFGDEGTAELFFINAVYGFLARFMNSAKIDFDPPIPGLEDTLRKYNAAAIEKEKTFTD
ncbi:hypothetical protein MPH_09166 [Macrophomina phaseolina MS6]|uniref:Carboxymuconolactone decarboxylase n=1 Tax=Macrophomina phaseolina (strain MS6) TaxID=1126212 RepID=K2S9Y5_MACPH|nr:hypothetical protein MPH_09166 [Macrophomina phaseolina MS6]